MYSTLTSSTSTVPQIKNLSLYLESVFLVYSVKWFLFFNYSKLLHLTVRNIYFAYCGMLHNAECCISHLQSLQMREINLDTSLFIERQCDKHLVKRYNNRNIFSPIYVATTCILNLPFYIFPATM
jgi:hypothetical protein